VFEKGPAAARQHFGDSAGNRAPDTRYGIEPSAAAALEDKGDIRSGDEQRLGGPSICGDPERVCPLRRENGGSLTQLAGNRCVRPQYWYAMESLRRNSHGPPPTASIGGPPSAVDDLDQPGVKSVRDILAWVEPFEFRDAERGVGTAPSAA
jgi:hypothetical protein